MSNVNKWPENVPTRTAEEWTALGANWSDGEARQAIVDALKGLKIPATEYARKQPPERVELIIKLQEQLSPGSTTGKKAAATPAATGTTAAKKTAAPKAGASTASTASTGGGGGTVDLTPVLAAIEAQAAAIAELQATATSIETLLKLVLANPNMADSLSLAADPDVLAEFAGKTITEIASGNG